MSHLINHNSIMYNISIRKASEFDLMHGLTYFYLS